MSDKCLRCKVRGDCCYVNVPIEGFNIILDNVHCPHLDTETGLCTTYDTRHQYTWCLDDSEMFEKGCLPEACEYLKEYSEGTPKIHLGAVINNPTISNDLKQKIWFQFLHYDNIPFAQYVQFLYKKEEVLVK